MTDPSEESRTRFDYDDFIHRVYERYPRLARAASSFRSNPLSGNTLRLLIRGEEEVTRDKNEVTALPNPSMWKQDSPIVLSQFGSYSSEAMASYWNSTLPDIQDKYGGEVRYQHHDVPHPSPSATEYKLATAGRAIQHHADEDAFWMWFNTIMVEGAVSMSDAYSHIESLNIDVDVNVIQEAVELDLYGGVLWDDIYTLLGRQGESESAVREQLEENGPMFALFINGEQVQPAYDAIVGVIEDIKMTQPTRP